MKKTFPIIVLLLIGFNACKNTSQQPEGVIIDMYSPDLADSTAVYIVGSIAEIGLWNPATVKMESLGNHTWRYAFKADLPDLVEYKFTLGSWEREASGANGLPLQNFVLKAKGDTLVKHEIYFWLDGERPAIQGQVTGHIDYTGKTKGEGLLDRDIIVWFPPNYEADLNKRFPVLYMHDGQNLFDPTTSSYGVDWQIDETLDSLSKLGIYEIPIVVGIYNTSQRTADYTVGPQSEDYMKFVVEKVKPFVDGNYRTLAQREYTSVGGSSYGGLISFRMAWEYPQVFSKAYCLSPALKIQNIDYVSKVMSSENRDLVFYIDNGGVGLEEQLQPGIDEMLEALKTKGYKQNTDFFWVLDQEARHFESAWAERMPHAFELMLEKK